MGACFFFWVFVFAACIPNRFCTPDVGVGKVVKCRLVDASTLTRNSIEYHSVGTQTKMRIYIDEDEDEKEMRSSMPDILLTGIPPGRKELMSNVIKELSMRFEKKVEEETISLLPERRSLVINGSPTGFSSTDDTTASVDLSYDDMSDVKKSITSLEDHIGHDFEGAVESDSLICDLETLPAKLFYPDLTASLCINRCDLHERDLNTSCESLFAEQDNMSLRTYVSSPDISLIGFDDMVAYASHSTSCEDITEDTVISCKKEYEEKDSSLKLEKERFPVINEIYNKQGNIIEDVVAYKNSNDVEEIKANKNSENNNLLAKDNNNNPKNEIFENDLSPISDISLSAYCYDSSGSLKENNNIFEENNDPLYSDLEICSDNDKGYEGDTDRTVYETLVLSKYTLDFSPASMNGYDADCEEMITSFKQPPNSLYTIFEETIAEI